MGKCLVSTPQMEMWKGSQLDGFVLDRTYISYYQVESALLDYPRILEAGVIATDFSQNQTLRVYLSLEGDLVNEDYFRDQVVQFIRQRFSLGCTITLKICEKLPMTRSGKILRTVLQEWN